MDTSDEENGFTAWYKNLPNPTYGWTGFKNAAPSDSKTV